MYKSIKAKEEINRRGKLQSIAHTINFLENIIKETKKNPIENFLQKEILRLKTIKENIEENGKSN